MPDNRTDGEDGSKLSGVTNRRMFMMALGSAGVTGLAGCGGDGDTETPTGQEDTETQGGNGTGTTEGGNGNGTTEGGNGNGNGTTETETETQTETDPGTRTDPPGCNITDPPSSIVSFDGVQDGAVVIPPSSETITGSFSNQYLGTTLESGSVELDVPDGEWTIEPASGTEFESLETGEASDITWNVSVPEESVEFDVTVMETYSCGGRTYEVETEQTMEVGPETPAPSFVDNPVDVSEGTPASVIRQNGHFTPLQLLPGGGAQMVYFPQESPEGQDPFESVAFTWGGNYDDDEWHHMVVSFDATDGLSGYIDGDLLGEGPDEPGELASANFAFGMAGAVTDPVSELYQGALDEVAVYDTAISADQAQSLADGDSPAEDSLVSKWSFEEIGFDRVQDQVGDNTLFLANGPEQVSGEVGQGIRFDGEQTFAGASNSDSLNLTTAKSVSFWFKTTQSL